MERFADYIALIAAIHGVAVVVVNMTPTPKDDEALSTYRRSAGLFGHEMHSPIMCIGNGIPAIVCRWAEQTSKGLMWRDIGLCDWLFDLDKEDELARVADTVLAMAKDPEGSKAKAAKARDFVMNRFATSMGVLRGELTK